MTGALIILAVTIIIGIILWLADKKHHPSDQQAVPDSTIAHPAPDASDTPDSPCCGLHLVCEKDSLSPMSADIIYYDDEELDRFAGRTPESYTPAETEEFREILMTMLAGDIEGWARSLTQRHISPPDEIRDEILLIVSDHRANPTQ